MRNATKCLSNKQRAEVSTDLDQVLKCWCVEAYSNFIPLDWCSGEETLLRKGVGMGPGTLHPDTYIPISHKLGFIGVCLFVGCLSSQQHASVSQGRICTDNFTCCHTEIEAADQTFHLTQWQYTDTGPTSPSADPITPGAWQGSHWSANF